ncbi:toll/interleukin-1 receptor domain-containing protein [Eubacterium sp. ER2]|uniref:toll/interleukin-1 receptor domain-containing protein n=1 Tax=Eubacterium sp. ER2 TaxID=1519438 RepID=UPI00051BC11F|nr:toll/interleukin-1 receptor domain-containing protein [Eubacterium sp. ER2]
MNEDMEFINFAENFFGQLPSEKNREYEKQLTKFTEQYSSQKHLGAYNRMIEEDHPNAYEAFFCLCTVYRHNRDYAKLHALLQSCNRFKKHLSYNHILAMYQVHSESFYDYDELLAMTCRDAEMMENNSGYLHTFANAFATICEKCGENNCDTIIGEWYEPALKAANKAIELEPQYAKYYSTKARIINLKGHYDEAIQLVMYAISLEKSERPDYALTISNYQYYRLYISMCQQRSLFENKIRLLERKLDRLSLGETANEAACTKQSDVFPRAYRGPEPFHFVSYAHLDKKTVYPLINRLQERGLHIWFDEGIEPGKEWPEEIALHIMQSRSVLVMLSGQSIHSPNVRRELSLALSENKKIIAVLLEEVVLTAGMRLQLELQQMVMKYQYSNENFLEKLYTCINEEL